MFISIVDAIDDGVFITDEKGIIIFVNNGYLQLTGLSRENLLNIPIQSLVKQGVISRSVSLDVIKTHQEKTLLQSLKNGKELLVTGHPVFNEEKKLIAVITSVRDITALTEAQNAQRELEDIKNTQKNIQA